MVDQLPSLGEQRAGHLPRWGQVADGLDILSFLNRITDMSENTTIPRTM